MPIPTNLEKLARQSAKERVLLQLQQWIIDGTLAPAEKISDVEIASALGVSRTPTREAMQVLELQGFLQVRPGKETRVSVMESKQIAQIYLPLATLQALAGELAAKSMTPHEWDTLTEINRHFTAAVHDGDIRSVMLLDDRFHSVIIEASGNPYVQNCIETLHLHVQRLRQTFHSKPNAALASINEHAQIVAALRAREGKLAAQAIRQNWLRPMAVLQELYGEEEH